MIRTGTAALLCALLLTPGELLMLAADTPPLATDKVYQAPAPAPTTDKPAPATDPAAAKDPAATAEKESPKLTAEQLDSLVAPIALYPDALLAQTLVAATYPLELVQLQQWLAKNPKLKDKALADAVAKQPWDPSIQSMAPIPDLVKRLSDDIQWTTDLGNAFLAQQGDVMDAVQRMRKKAQDKGALESNEQQKVSEKKVEDKTVIVVESSNPEVIYVPSYSPTVVYGAAVYPYPPIYYPAYPPGAAFMSFSIGVMWGAAIWGGGCCGCGWGGNDIDINVNNNFNRNNINTGDIGSGNRGGASAKGGTGNRGGASAGTMDRGAGGAGGGAGGGQKWSHNPQHRGGTPYADKGTASKYGGNARGDSLSQRQSKAGGSAGNRPSSGNLGAGGGGSRSGSPSAGNLGAGGSGSRGGGDKIGNRSVGSSSGRQSGFGGGSGGFSGASARSSSSRGSSSMGGRSFGGGGGGRRR